jgi:hypothetical protein
MILIVIKKDEGNKMKVKVSAGFSGVIATGSYENSRPSYTAEIETDYEGPEDGGKALIQFIETRQKVLQEICLRNFKQDEQNAIIERIQKERQDIRFYDGLPSVTSIIGWDEDFFVPPVELVQYAAQGNLTHAQVAHYIKTVIWESPEKIEGTWADIVILKKGSLGLAINGTDFPAFLKKYPLEGMKIGKVIKSLKYKFAGTPDIRECYFDKKKTLADVKRTADKIKNFKQMAAYILAEEENGETPYDQMMIIPLNNKTEQGFSKPIIGDREAIEQYKKMFLRDRENFAKRFGI